MTSEQDYGNWYSPNYASYSGRQEQICTTCGIKREVMGWQAWKYQLDDAEKNVNYLLSIEPKKDT